MCRKLALAATAVLLLATPVMAADASKAPARAIKADKTLREMIERETPLSRANFWSREVAADPADAEAGLKYAAALRAMGKYDQAAEAAETVTVQHQDNAEAWLAVARARVESGAGFYAIIPAKRAQALNAKDWRPLSILGVAYEQIQRDDVAMESYNKALALSPGNPDILTNIALLHAANGDAAKAESLLRQALAQPKVTSRTRQNLALLVGRQGRIEEARKLMLDDLPPEVVENNVAYLRAASATPEEAPKPAASRSWEALRADGG